MMIFPRDMVGVRVMTSKYPSLGSSVSPVSYKKIQTHGKIGFLSKQGEFNIISHLIQTIHVYLQQVLVEVKFIIKGNVQGKRHIYFTLNSEIYKLYKFTYIRYIHI